jgi:hydrogenase maturation protein HypF
LIRIIGIGSPFGDDATGLLAAQILANAPPPNCEVIVADRPGVTLVELMEGAEAVILIDAVRSGAAPGTIHELSFDDLGQRDAHLVSSHDLDIVTAVQLARQLGRAPDRALAIGLEVAAVDPRRPCEVSANVRQSIDQLVARVRSCAARLDHRVRQRLTIAGTVQGVGMRPFVWRMAKSVGLAGYVRNIPGGVEIEIEGSPASLQKFRHRLMDERPIAAAIESVVVTSVRPVDETEFRAIESERGRAATTIPPDLAICADCTREILDRASRRYRYPFTNCTACGPRFTVVQTLPYDRAATTLAGFPLCEECQREYLDPADHRFRAEPIACPRCGPRAWLETTPPEPPGAPADRDSIVRAAEILRAGGIVAVQGVGGVHLACDANHEMAVIRLRRIKRRPHKPLAVMVDSIESARTLATVSDDEAALLVSPLAPIVVLRKNATAKLAASIAPGNDHVGIMIAYSPIHRLLMSDVGLPLVMTSANRPGEPLARDGVEARAIFGSEVDAMLLHDRPIHQRCDDGVWMAGPKGAQPIRRSRGSTPRPITVPVSAKLPILAAGADIKNSFCLLHGHSALMSQYIGSLENVATQEHFHDALEKWVAVSGIEPALSVHDLHPNSVVRELVGRLGLKSVAVQHHHAHVAACLAEHGHRGPAIGIAFDGTGYGTDGAIWGGEAMIVDLLKFERLSHLEYLPLVGGDTAVRDPRRIAAAFLTGLFGSLFRIRVERLVGSGTAKVLATMIDRNINTFPTSSCGRMFDAVAALTGVCGETTYEAQAAIELESLARTASPVNHIYPFMLRDGVVGTGAILAAIIGDLELGTPAASVARAFHNTMAEIVARMAADARARTGVSLVALSGGCFQNRLLLAASTDKLESERFTVLVHRAVPANDGGLALGQAVIAAAQLSCEGAGDLSCASEFRAA